ncbi:helix-turn-helix transcriptional regulator [Stenotrophomonas sp. MMGLT7]|uniref:helix-turn-helix transcriptional regulator n=1 Tax=Stenotrophomonas sp. MMGLT7 TaxID=2901227 RepID=UPI001E310123|nr:helix-turn-helix transcriptional regulator [Stenotrophomonas sp. MMGLT7]MCD7099323.1 helix-turn-helix transcriptional regulator [Stenotrophomonas sp. MMGLT7]
MSGIVRRDDLLMGMDLIGGGYRFSREPAADLPLLAGRTFTRELRAGLVLHCTQARDLQDLESEAELAPGVKIVLLVDGATEVGYGSHSFRLGPLGEQVAMRAGNFGALVNLAEPDLFRRRWRAGRPERKVSITLKPEWIESAGLHGHDAGRRLKAFLRGHMSQAPWTPSGQALVAADAILRPPPLPAGLLALHLEARCLDIVLEACSVIARESPQSPSLGPRQQRRMRALRELLDSGQADAWDLQRIARHVAINTTSLQLEFRAAYGTTVFAYLRERRMREAYALLARGRASIAMAAQRAGYGSSANFSTAFKRRFGITPGQARGRT